TRAVSVPTRPAPERAPASKKPAEPTSPGSILEGLIDLRHEDPLFDTMLDRYPSAAALNPSQQVHRTWSTAVEQLSRIGPRRWWAAAGVLLLGLVLAWAVVLKVKTANGVIVLENLPENAVVEIDGDRVAVTPTVGAAVTI